MIKDFINSRFGTHRGLIRMVISYALWLLGPYRTLGRVDWSRVQRIVFVCQGNICRSPFAHRRFRQMTSALPVASFGLSTNSGSPADATAIDVAKQFGIDLSDHRATDAKDFEIADGDLLFVMEDRHAKAVTHAIAGRAVQIALLGLWYRPYFALLYDPHTLSRAYFVSCLRRIDMAVQQVCDDLKNHRPELR